MLHLIILPCTLYNVMQCYADCAFWHGVFIRNLVPIFCNLIRSCVALNVLYEIALSIYHMDILWSPCIACFSHNRQQINNKTIYK